MEKYAIYNDEDAASWQGMIVGHKYKILDIDFTGGVAWFKTYQSNGGHLGKKRWTSSTSFEEVKGDF